MVNARAFFYLSNAGAFSYTKFGFEYYQTSGTTMIITVGLRQDPDWYYLDDFYVIDTVTGATMNNDPSFETGGLSACCGGSSTCNTFGASPQGTVVSGNAHTGTYCFRDGAVGNPDYFTVTITNIVIGRTYNISFWLMNTTGTPNTAIVIVGS